MDWDAFLAAYVQASAAVTGVFAAFLVSLTAFLFEARSLNEADSARVRSRVNSIADRASRRDWARVVNETANANRAQMLRYLRDERNRKLQDRAALELAHLFSQFSSKSFVVETIATLAEEASKISEGDPKLSNPDRDRQLASIRSESDECERLFAESLDASNEISAVLTRLRMFNRRVDLLKALSTAVALAFCGFVILPLSLMPRGSDGMIWIENPLDYFFDAPFRVALLSGLIGLALILASQFRNLSRELRFPNENLRTLEEIRERATHHRRFRDATELNAWLRRIDEHE